MDTIKCRDIVDSHVTGWKTCPLLEPAVDDNTWILRWAMQLRSAKAVFVVYSKAYRRKCLVGSALMKEAVEIICRHSMDSTFHVYVLDPQQSGEDPPILKTFLDIWEHDYHFEQWREFLRGQGIEQMLQEALPSQQVNQAMIVVDTDIEVITGFDNKHAQNKQRLHLSKGMRGTVIEMSIETGDACISFSTIKTKQWVASGNFCYLAANPARPSSFLATLSQRFSLFSRSLQTSWASADKDHLQRYHSVVSATASRWHLSSSAEQAVWERELQYADAALVLFSENYRTHCTPGSQLMLQADKILSRALTAGFRVAVLDPGMNGQGPHSVPLFLSDAAEYPHLNIESLRSFISAHKLQQLSIASPPQPLVQPDPVLFKCNHVFEEVTLLQPRSCSECGKFLWGLNKQGQQCRLCTRIMCRSCSTQVSSSSSNSSSHWA